MELWVKILIAVGAVAGVFLFLLLLGFLLFLLSGRLQKKVRSEFAKTLPYEERRIEVLKRAWAYVDQSQIDYRKDFRESFEKAFDTVLTKDGEERRKAKELIDFALLYTRKLLEERGKGKAEERELVEEIRRVEKEGRDAYEAYDQVAVRYNAVLSMIFVKLINKLSKKHRREPAVLY